MNPRVYIASVRAPVLPDLPDNLMAVYDKVGVRWNRRLGPAPMAGAFSPDPPQSDPYLPRILSWYQLVTSRGPLAECTPAEFLYG